MSFVSGGLGGKFIVACWKLCVLSFEYCEQTKNNIYKAPIFCKKKMRMREKM